MSSKKQAAQRQVTAMKMRHQAQPGDPKDAKAAVPMNERVHLRVGRPDTETERVFWFRKVLSILSSPPQPAGPYICRPSAPEGH